jgi:hypothetical protein
MRGTVFQRRPNIDCHPDAFLNHPQQLGLRDGSNCVPRTTKRVVVPIYGTRLLDRSWLYTAVTRAEQQVVLVGNRDVFKTAVAKPPAATLRTTGLRWPSPK